MLSHVWIWWLHNKWMNEFNWPWHLLLLTDKEVISITKTVYYMFLPIKFKTKYISLKFISSLTSHPLQILTSGLFWWYFIKISYLLFLCLCYMSCPPHLPFSLVTILHIIFALLWVPQAFVLSVLFLQWLRATFTPI